MTAYINRQGGGYTETVDEFETWTEAKKLIAEYRLSDPSGNYWISRRACKAWRDEKKKQTGGES